MRYEPELLTIILSISLPEVAIHGKDEDVSVSCPGPKINLSLTDERTGSFVLAKWHHRCLQGECTC